MRDAAWLLVPAALVVVVFVLASLRAGRPGAGGAVDRVAEYGFYASLFVGAVLLLGLMIARTG